MKKEAKYEARCCDCGGPIAPGGTMNYSPPAGKYPAEYRHIKCPEPKKVTACTVNNAPRHDPERDIVWRTCKCGTEWTVPRGSSAAKRDPFTVHCCAERDHQAERHLRAVA
jgi:hypothetical protein